VRRKFSEQYGFVKPRELFQINKIDVKLQNRIWNQIKRYFLDNMSISINGFIENKT